MHKDCRLYNVIFPVWLIWLFPVSLLIVLPANFIIDSLVLLIFMAAVRAEGRREIYKKSILKIWGCGFFADCIGSLFLFTISMLDSMIPALDASDWFYDNITNPISFNPFKSVWGVVIIVLIIAVSGFFIYLFDYKFALNKTSLSDRDRRRAALSLAIATAPYTFLLPTSWFYNA